jgi:hypothetical protein
MTAKKKQEEEVLAEVEVQETQPGRCGHVNHQHYGTNGRLEKVACDLPDGHAGDHHAKYTRNVKDEPETDAKGRVMKQTYHTEEADAWWNDAAGKPARPVDNDAIQMSLLQKDLIMQVTKENPRLTIEQATEQAKALPQWNAAALS